MKRAFAFILLICLSLSVFSCGGNDSGTELEEARMASHEAIQQKYEGKKIVFLSEKWGKSSDEGLKALKDTYLFRFEGYSIDGSNAEWFSYECSYEKSVGVSECSVLGCITSIESGEIIGEHGNFISNPISLYEDIEFMTDEEFIYTAVANNSYEVLFEFAESDSEGYKEFSSLSDNSDGRKIDIMFSEDGAYLRYLYGDYNLEKLIIPESVCGIPVVGAIVKAIGTPSESMIVEEISVCSSVKRLNIDNDILTLGPTKKISFEGTKERYFEITGTSVLTDGVSYSFSSDSSDN